MRATTTATLDVLESELSDLRQALKACDRVLNDARVDGMPHVLDDVERIHEHAAIRLPELRRAIWTVEHR